MPDKAHCEGCGFLEDVEYMIKLPTGLYCQVCHDAMDSKYQENEERPCAKE